MNKLCMYVCMYVCMSRAKSKSYLLVVPGGNSSFTAGEHDLVGIVSFVTWYPFLILYQLPGEGLCQKAL